MVALKPKKVGGHSATQRYLAMSAKLTKEDGHTGTQVLVRLSATHCTVETRLQERDSTQRWEVLSA